MTTRNIRPLLFADIARVSEIAAAAYKGSAFDGVPVDPQTFYAFLRNAAVERHAGAWVAEKNGRVEGVLVAGLHPLFFSKQYVAMNHLILVSKEGRGLGLRLIRHFIKWAKANPRVSSITLSATSGMPEQARVEKLFSRLGRRVGALYEV